MICCQIYSHNKRISEIEYKRQKEESDRLRNQTERVSLQMMKTLAATIEARMII